jgi:hypothetical protein
VNIYELACFWLGAVTFGILAIVGLFSLGDWALDKVIRSLGLYKELIVFFTERVRARRGKVEVAP